MPPRDSQDPESLEPFAEPIHVGRPNIADPDRFIELVKSAVDRKWLSNDGPILREFESAVAELLGVRHCVAISNGTIALEIAIKAAGLTGEVIVPAWTFVATAHAVQWHGLTPVFVDIDPDTHNLDPDAVRRAITPRTSAILAVHLWGRPSPVDELTAIADEHDLTLFFDAAHAFGVSHAGRRVGGFGRAEVLSFHATKFFNAIEGGAIVTDDDEFARVARLMRNFGFAGEDTVISEGTNGKMSEVSAAMGLANLPHLGDLVEANKVRYQLYRDGLSGLRGVSVLEHGDGSNYQYVVMLVDETCPASRDEILAALRSKNVLARRYFWPGVHRMEPYRTLDPTLAERLPATELVSEQVIVLPTGPTLREEDVVRVCDIVRKAVEGG